MFKKLFFTFVVVVVDDFNSTARDEVVGTELLYSKLFVVCNVFYFSIKFESTGLSCLVFLPLFRFSIQFNSIQALFFFSWPVGLAGEVFSRNS
jgi:hypothetical protein